MDKDIINRKKLIDFLMMLFADETGAVDSAKLLECLTATLQMYVVLTAKKEVAISEHISNWRSNFEKSLENIAVGLQSDDMRETIGHFVNTSFTQFVADLNNQSTVVVVCTLGKNCKPCAVKDGCTLRPFLEGLEKDGKPGN